MLTIVVEIFFFLLSVFLLKLRESLREMVPRCEVLLLSFLLMAKDCIKFIIHNEAQVVVIIMVALSHLSAVCTMMPKRDA